MSYKTVFAADLFKNQKLIVTGGGSGIGRCIAHELASLGGEILLLGRTEEKLTTVQQEITEDGGKAQTYVCDVRNSDRVQAVMQEISTVQGLVNCAGGQFPALLSEMSMNGFDAVVRNNLTSTFNVSKAAYEHCMGQSGGSIVNITANDIGGMPLMGHTAAARAGVHSLTQTCALEWAEKAIRINAVAPGYIASSGFDTYTDPRMLEAIKRFPAGTPLGRTGTEAEISAAVVFLLSPAAAYITGQIIRVDGGASLNVGTAMYDLQTAQGHPEYDGFHRSSKPAIVTED
ncbi:MAG: SDR family oxidoreductase [Pseudomonadales bacterium]|nr:SDR family oxidoreductase [Pseudomonadales bacterium]